MQLPLKQDTNSISVGPETAPSFCDGSIRSLDKSLGSVFSGFTSLKLNFMLIHQRSHTSIKFLTRISHQNLWPFDFRELIFTKAFATSEDSFVVNASASLYLEATSITTNAYLYVFFLYVSCGKNNSKSAWWNFVWFIYSLMWSRNVFLS